MGGGGTNHPAILSPGTALQRSCHIPPWRTCSWCCAFEPGAAYDDHDNSNVDYEYGADNDDIDGGLVSLCISLKYCDFKYLALKRN